MKHLQVYLPTLKMVHTPTSRLVDSGVVDLKGHFLMSGSSTLTPGQTDISSSQPVTAVMRMPKSEPMNNAFVR